MNDKINISREEAIKSINEVLSSDYHYNETLGYELTSDDFGWLEKSIFDMKKLQKIEYTKNDLEKLEKNMYKYFNIVNLESPKTELEKLALDIVCVGIQTIGFLNNLLKE